MSTLQDVPSKATYNRVFGVLTDSTRRHIVELLRRRQGPMGEAELVARLVSKLNQNGGSEVTAEQIQTRLHHLHLPKLAESGLVAWDRTEHSVVHAGNPLQGANGVDALQAVEDADSVAAALSGKRRRSIVAALEDAGEPMDRSDLAREVAEANADGEPSPAAVDDVEIQLHHSSLPALEDAGLVEYDAASETVTYAGPAEVTTLLRTIE